MADQAVPDPLSPGWRYNGNSLLHYVEIPSANCRPAKSVVNCIVGPITSECISNEQCPPFNRAYRRWSFGLTLFSVVPGLGVGCLMQQTNAKFVRRSQPDAQGDFVSAGQSFNNTGTVVISLNSEFGSPVWLGPEYFGSWADPALSCP